MNKLSEKFLECQSLLEKYLNLVNQDDKKIIQNFDNHFDPLKLHPFIREGLDLSSEKLIEFDANRDFNHIKNPEWQDLIFSIKRLKKFQKIKSNSKINIPYGNKKKLHEFQSLHSYLKDLPIKGKCGDFGGGIGNLSIFLAREFNINPIVIEENIDFCDKGLKRFHKEEIEGNYLNKKVNQSEIIPEIKEIPFAIGLHTCGSFAVNMMKSCFESQVKSILNFGCCYSKIENDEYQLSSLADRKLELNQRVLSAGTLSFSSVRREIYNFRVKIQNYKYAFYHFQNHKKGDFEFLKMGNSRRSLYDKSFSIFATEVYEEFFPNLEFPNKLELETFYQAKFNQSLLKYFQVYYAIARYIGELVELYILYDRACFLEEKGYQVEILEFFNPCISPRNKGIYATLK